MSKKKIVAIVGPTASGKSDLAMKICQIYNGELVSCDSMQIYRQMDIGTAKPSICDMQTVRHHMVDICEPYQEFTVADYVDKANEAVDGIISRGHLPVFCGGTGLYFDAFLFGGFEDIPDTTKIRDELTKKAEMIGKNELYRELEKIDHESALNIHPNNVRRVIRALEIYYATGTTKSEYDRRSREAQCKYDARVICLTYSDREQLYSRIDKRVDQMLHEGLFDEVKLLAENSVFERSKTASQAIGYKELYEAIKGRCTVEEATDIIKLDTRHYAKRQLTWFLSKDYVHVLDKSKLDDNEILEKTIEIIGN